MNILPFQADIAARMLVNTENEQIHPQHNSYTPTMVIGWHGMMALPPYSPPIHLPMSLVFGWKGQAI